MRREAVFLKDTENPEGGWLTSVWYAALEEEYLDPKVSDGRGGEPRQ
jgi:hypothetical protein